MTRDAVPHGPTSPLSDERPRTGTSGPSVPSGRQIAAEGRATGPTEGEIPDEWVEAGTQAMNAAWTAWLNADDPQATALRIALAAALPPDRGAATGTDRGRDRGAAGDADRCDRYGGLRAERRLGLRRPDRARPDDEGDAMSDTRPDLAAIKARAEAATQSEWTLEFDSDWDEVSDTRFNYVNALRGPKSPYSSASVAITEIAELLNADAEHIAGMDPPTTLALVAYVERCEAETARLRAAVERVQRLLLISAKDWRDGETGMAYRHGFGVGSVEQMQAVRAALTPDAES